MTFDPATNHQTGVNYDANGNPTDGKIYDVENRIISEPGYQQYTYDYRGKRITKLMGSTTELYFYGIDGRKLATYQCAAGTQQNNYQFTCSSPTFDTYWKGKLVKSKGQEVTTDRLGSVRWARDDGWRAYFPYGAERWASNDNREKFGTYVRDNSTQDYADQRYYGPGTGRFFTPDPSWNGVNMGDPASWNLYSYALRDPINGFDPTGLADCDPTGLNGPICPAYSDGGGDVDGVGSAAYLQYLSGVADSTMVSYLNHQIETGNLSITTSNGLVLPANFSWTTQEGQLGLTISVMFMGEAQTMTLGEFANALASGALNIATALPQSFFAGFVNALLNDDLAKGGAQVGGSLAAAVLPGAIFNAMAPSVLYHFTTQAGYEGIVAAGQIFQGAGITGFGVYGTAIPAGWTVSWAGIATDAMVEFSPGLSAIYPGLLPGVWWRVVPTVTTLLSSGIPITPIP